MRRLLQADGQAGVCDKLIWGKCSDVENMPLSKVSLPTIDDGQLVQAAFRHIL